VRSDVNAILGAEDIFDIALGRPSPQLKDLEPEEFQKEATVLLSQAGESLFQLLPAIRTLRHQKILEAELKPEREKASTPVANTIKGTVQGSVAGKFTRSTASPLHTKISSYLLDKTIDDAANLIEDLEEETPATQKDKSAQSTFATLCKKELERLEDWRYAVKKRNPKSFSDEETTKITKTLEKMRQYFCKST